MAMERAQFLEKLLRGYSAYYDVTQMEPDKAPMVATAFFHMTSAKYMLFKEAEIWAVNCNEYIYVFDVPVLTAEVFEKCVAMACEDGIPRVQPDKNHMSSYVDAVFVCDECTPEGIQALKKYRNRKSFKFSLQGWMEVHTAAVDLGKGTVEANYPSSETAKYLNSVLHGRKRSKLKPLETFLKILRD